MILLSTIRHWECPNCHATDTTKEPKPHTRFHSCPKMGGLTAPMIPAGTTAKITSHEREDYVGKDIVRLNDDGRPVMSITTEREEGQDVVVFAPTATATGEVR